MYHPDGRCVVRLVDAHDDVHLRGALVNDADADLSRAQGGEEPGADIRAADHAPANHSDHGKAVLDHQTVRVDGTGDPIAQRLPVALQRGGGHHQANAAQAGGQVRRT